MSSLHAAPSFDARAAEAERSVVSFFGGRLLGIPHTHIAQLAFPAPARLGWPWHYWWQAHYLDVNIDAALRHQRQGNIAAARQLAVRGDRILATIRWRNGARLPNAYYDDMAWLVLAVDRLRLLHDALGGTRPDRRLRRAEQALSAQLRSAMTEDLGGGLFWNTSRNFKNVAATAPWALHLARTGDPTSARRLVEWIYARLESDHRGLFIDGVRLVDGAEQAVTDIYTYNQGSVLGALLALGDETDLARARGIIAAVDDRLTTTRPGEGRPLRTHGGGDGGLFTGILARYLSLAATHPALGDKARATAKRLVLDTAEALWTGRDLRHVGGRSGLTVFSCDPMLRARDNQPVDEPVEMSTQVQAWTIFEAAASIPWLRNRPDKRPRPYRAVPPRTRDPGGGTTCAVHPQLRGGFTAPPRPLTQQPLDAASGWLTPPADRVRCLDAASRRRSLEKRGGEPAGCVPHGIPASKAAPSKLTGFAYRLAP